MVARRNANAAMALPRAPVIPRTPVIPSEARDLGFLSLQRRGVMAFIRSEFHRDRLAVGLGGFEELAALEAEHASENIRGEHLNLRIQVAYHGVVVAARVLNI